MGITDKSLIRIDKFVKERGKLLILGCQNLYSAELYMQVAHPYFEDAGHAVRSWDILGCQGSEAVDLRENLELLPEYDYIFQHGTIEHCDGSLYWPFRNIHECCAVGGIMIHENPKVGNWPDHGRHYFTTKFYIEFSEACGYVICELSEEPAMGNMESGWNVCAVLKKCTDVEFITEDKFNQIYERNVFTK